MINSKKITVSIGSVVILVLAVIAFVLAPMITDRNSASPLVLGKWGRIHIDNGPSSPFINQYRFLHNYADSQKMIPENPQSREFFEHQILDISLKGAIIQTAMEDEVSRAGYKVPAFKVNKELINYYLDETGAYSNLKYNETPETQKVEYRKAIEKELTINRYIEDVFGSGKNYGLKTSSKETEFVSQMTKKERSFQFVTFDSTMYPLVEIKKYGEEHSELFTAYNFSMLTYNTEEEAKKTLASLKKEEVKFDDAVILNTSKTLTDETGKLTANYRTDINRYFPDNENLKLILELKPQELSSVVRLHNGMFAIVRCDADPLPPDFSSETLLDSIRTYINKNEKGLIEDYLIESAKKFAETATTQPFDKAVENFTDFHLNLETTNSFSINYGNASILQPLPSNMFINSVKENEVFFKKAFSLKADEISEPILAGSNVVVLKLNEEKDADQYTLDNTKTGYENQAGSWFGYYQLAMLMSAQGINYPLPIAHRTFMDYIFDNPKFENSLYKLFK